MIFIKDSDENHLILIVIPTIIKKNLQVKSKLYFNHALGVLAMVVVLAAGVLAGAGGGVVCAADAFFTFSYLAKA